MKVIRSAMAGSLLASIVLMLPGTTAAQGFAAPNLRQSTAVRQSGLAYDDYLSYGPQTGSSRSPSDRPPAAAEQPGPVAKSSGEAEAEEPNEEEQGFKLFKCCWLECHRIDVRGWLDQGFTWNPENPVNRMNTPVAYNDRSNEYQMNQLYLIAERLTKTDGCGWDIGGRVDLLYGTDRRFPFAVGLDDHWNDGQRFYGLVMPQLYADFACNDLIFRAGHFLAPCGYESVMAPANFFYSHTYDFLYGQPTTLTGGSLIYKLNESWSVNAGLDTGWNNWEAVNQRLSYFGGVNWTGEDQKSTVAWELFLGNQLPNPDSFLTHYCLVATHKPADKLTFALENNCAWASNAVTAGNGLGTASFWGIAAYGIYEINKCWSFALRYEYFSDDQGVVVPFDDGVFRPARYNALSCGVNYKPGANVIVRSAVRGDWAGVPEDVDVKPFKDLTRNEQFLWDLDLIVKF